MKFTWHLLLLLTLRFSTEALYVINEPSSIVYSNPEEGGVIEDILPYGTSVEMTEEKGPWTHITYPSWHGWILKSKLLVVKEDPKQQANAFIGFRGGYIYKMTDTECGPLMQLPFETPVKVIQELPEAHRRWVLVQLQDGNTYYMQRSQLTFSKAILTMSEAAAFSQQFLGIKYLWGGTTSFGYDCSGFVQMLYRQMGITLPRNSNQQAIDPRFKEVPFNEAQTGDLVFFKNGSGKVTHVGMMLDGQTFIHAFTKEESWISKSSLFDERFSNGYFYYTPILKRFNP